MKHTMNWCKPPPRALKLNIDGAIFLFLHSVGVRRILRDETGTVLMADSIKGMEGNDPTEIELIAIMRGLQLCILMDIVDLIVDSDSLLTIN